MQTHQGPAHDGELDDDGHGPLLDGDGGGDQRRLVGLMPAAVSQLHWMWGGLKPDSAPRTLDDKIFSTEMIQCTLYDDCFFLYWIFQMLFSNKAVVTWTIFGNFKCFLKRIKTHLSKRPQLRKELPSSRRT